MGPFGLMSITGKEGVGMKRVLMSVWGVLVAVMLFSANAATAEAGYWQLVKTTGKKDRSDPPIVGTGWQNKYQINGNTLMFYSYTHEGLQKQLQYSWSGVPDRLFPGKTATMTVEGKAVRREPRWQNSNDLQVVFSGGFIRLGLATVGAEAGYTDNPLKRVLEINVPQGDARKSDPYHFGYIHIQLGHNTDKDTYTYVYEWIDGAPVQIPERNTAVSAAAGQLDISGDWLCTHDGRKCQIVQSGTTVTLINETGQQCSGRFVRSNALSICSEWGSQEGRIGAYYQGKRMAATEARDHFGLPPSEIRWSGGNVWRRSGM